MLNPDQIREILPPNEELSSERILSIRNSKDINLVVSLAQTGRPFGFAGFGVYGLGGTKKGIIEIAKVKGRDLREKPPVCLPSWQLLEEVVDWNKLAGKRILDETLKRVLHEIYFSYPVHFIMPLKIETSDIFLYPKNRMMNDEETATYAFMMTGLNPDLQNLINQFEKKCRSPFFVTSANISGEASITTVEKFKEIFPEIPVLEDSIMEEVMPGYPSHTMFDLIPFPNKGEISVVRIGSLAPTLIADALVESGLQVSIVEEPETRILNGFCIKEKKLLTELCRILVERTEVVVYSSSDV